MSAAVLPLRRPGGSIPFLFIVGAIAALCLMVASPALATSTAGWDFGDHHDARSDWRSNGHSDWNDDDKSGDGNHGAYSCYCGPSGDGISLADLVGDGGSFSSLSGVLSFTNFSADLDGKGDLENFYLVPTDDGFALSGALIGLFGATSELSLSYDVGASAGFQIESMSMTISGFSFLGDAGALLDAFAPGSEDPVGQLEAEAFNFWNLWSQHDGRHDETDLTEAAQNLIINEKIFAKAGLLAAAWYVDQSFDVAPVPEPAPAMMVGLGLLIAGVARKRRRTA
jgi:hypothetical protein